MMIKLTNRLKLSESSLELSVNGLFLGAFTHTDDI